MDQQTLTQVQRIVLEMHSRCDKVCQTDSTSMLAMGATLALEQILNQINEMAATDQQ